MFLAPKNRRVQKHLLSLALATIAANLIGCGVKGPPEAPYPTEATTKKDVSKQDASGHPAAVPFATPKITPDTGAPDTATKATKKKKKSQ